MVDAELGYRVVLPGGFWAEGILHRVATIRPLTGYDEEYLAAHGRSFPLARKTTEALLRTVRSVGSFRPIDRQVVRSLQVGDREALLLQLRRLALGDRLECIVRCQESGCGETMDLELTCGDLLLPAYADPQPVFERTIAAGGREYSVRFRVPTGEDQETAASTALQNLPAAYSLVMERCVERVVARNGGGDLTDYPDGLAAGIAAAMADADPQAELRLNATCTACGSRLSVLFDAAAFFFRELEERGRHLYHQVHRLASRYHWAESEILGMTTSKRLTYLALLAESAGYS